MIRFGAIGQGGGTSIVLVVGDEGVVPLRDISGVPAACHDSAIALLEHLPQVMQIVRNFKGRPQPMPAQWLSPIPNPPSFRDFYAFEAHVKAARALRGLDMIPQWYEIPVFYFSNAATPLGSGMPVFAPANSKELDYELELAAVIGTGGRDIPAAKGLEHIAGFMILNDHSARDLQRKEMPVNMGPAKGKDFASSFGPYLVPTAELKDKFDEKGRLHLKMTARVNGKELSRGDSSTMQFTWGQLVEHASRDALVRRGDILGSGTVGTGCILELTPEKTGGWLKGGDLVELEIERLGVLSTPIVARPGV